MRSFWGSSIFTVARQGLAVAVSFSLLGVTQASLCAQEPGPPPPPQGGYEAPPPGSYEPLGAEQIDELVAPIALYPDSLVAQVLTASTYPQQVSEADRYVQQSGGMPPGQLAASVDTMPWDPSVKGLTAFPSVLNNMERNAGWTAALGNAYYNQPGDVMNGIQAMRIRAEQTGNFRTTPQLRVFDSGGTVVVEPVNPEVVYVPYYDPWRVYGGPIRPWDGWYAPPPPRGLFIGLGIGFAVGISVGLFAHYGWGYHSWSPNWRGGTVVYNRTNYYSRSVTVINNGHFGAYNRGVYEHAGPGVPAGFRPPVTHGSAAFARPAGGWNGGARPAPGGAMNGGARPAPGEFRRGFQNQPQVARPPSGMAGGARPQVPNAQPQQNARQGFARPQTANPQTARPPVNNVRPNNGGSFNRPNVRASEGVQRTPPPAANRAPNPPAVHPSGNAGGAHPAHEKR